MGANYFFHEDVTQDDNSRVRCKPKHVEVLDNHLVPEITIQSLDDDQEIQRATFNNWEQYEKFVEAVNDVYHRLKSDR